MKRAFKDETEYLFHHFQRVNKTSFWEGEGPTLTQNNYRI